MTPTEPTLVGESPAMLAVAERIPVVSRARRTTLICGPTGSGKEVIAAKLHRAAFPHGAPYIPVHCGALPEHIVESELFGHTRGAFTGASHARDGLVRSAANGTLFLDEVDSLSLAVQTKLLRFIDSGEYRPVGSDRSERARVWVLAATNADLEEKVAANEFREDLYYRLDVMRIDLPPLRLRSGDVELLADYFLSCADGTGRTFSPAARQALVQHDWPGNVRELKHKVERAAYNACSSMIEPADLGLNPRAPKMSAPVDMASTLWNLIERDGMTLSEALSVCEKRLIGRALEIEGHNRTKAAARLGIHVRTMFKKLSR